MIPFHARSLLERGLILSGLSEPQARQAAFAGPEGFDLTRWPKSKRKAYDFDRKVAPYRITAHVTDVRGGFGVSKRRVRFWHERLDLDARDEWWLPDYIPQLPTMGWEDAANRLALWERLHEQAYHQVAAANGDSLATRGIESWSWHAGKWANARTCGFAVDCHHAQELDEWMIETGRAALRALVSRMAAFHEVEMGVPLDAPLLIAPHRAHDADRRVDPQGNKARGVWTDIVLPVVKSTDELAVDYELKTGRGRPVPDVWDPHALYDWKGRKL